MATCSSNESPASSGAFGVRHDLVDLASRHRPAIRPPRKILDRCGGGNRWSRWRQTKSLPRARRETASTSDCAARRSPSTERPCCRDAAAAFPAARRAARKTPTARRVVVVVVRGVRRGGAAAAAATGAPAPRRRARRVGRPDASTDSSRRRAPAVLRTASGTRRQSSARRRSRGRKIPASVPSSSPSIDVRHRPARRRRTRPSAALPIRADAIHCRASRGSRSRRSRRKRCMT